MQKDLSFFSRNASSADERIFVEVVDKFLSYAFFLPCSSGSTILDIMALITGVGIPPRQATKGTNAHSRSLVLLSVLYRHNYRAAILLYDHIMLTCYSFSSLPNGHLDHNYVTCHVFP